MSGCQLLVVSSQLLLVSGQLLLVWCLDVVGLDCLQYRMTR